MKLELAAPAGQLAETTLELRQTAGDKPKIVDIHLVELGQNSEGGWQFSEPGSLPEASKDFSCYKWLQTDKTSLELKLLEAVPLRIGIKVPATARGVYFAAVLVQTRPEPTERGLNIVVRFLIPIIVEIQGRPERQKIGLENVDMSFQKAAGSVPAKTSVMMGIDNQGRTYSRIKGAVKVTGFVNGRWRPVSICQISECGIIPGAKLNLSGDLSRRLPSGKYKLTGTLYVDGRRLKPLEKEVDFVGDPTVTKLAVDTALVLDPPTLSIASAPGSTRTSTIKVENASEDTVEINASSVVPPHIRGMVMGELKGEDLSCAGWVKVEPAKFTLRAGGKQNVRVIATMPKTDKPQANYYGVLTLKATYPDGQSAGETSTLVCVSDKQAESKPSAETMKLTVAADEGSQYIVQARFGNTGNVDYVPTCTASVLTPQGQAVTQIDLAGQEGLMLPLETRDFSASIDFDKIEPGTYALKVSLDCGGGKGASQQLPIKVTVEEGKKVVTVVAAAETPKP